MSLMPLDRKFQRGSIIRICGSILIRVAFVLILWFYPKAEKIYEHGTSYKKQAKISIDHIDDETWGYWKWKMLSKFPVDRYSKRSIKMPDHGFKRQEWCEGYHWTSSITYFLNQDWEYKKWLDAGTAVLFRSKLIKLILKRNSWTGEIKSEFDYRTQFYNDSNCKWEEI